MWRGPDFNVTNLEHIVPRGWGRVYNCFGSAPDWTDEGTHDTAPPCMAPTVARAGEGLIETPAGLRRVQLSIPRGKKIGRRVAGPSFQVECVVRRHLCDGVWSEC